MPDIFSLLDFASRTDPLSLARAAELFCQAQSVTLNGVLIDATIAHDRIMVDKALHAVEAPRLPTILTSVKEQVAPQKVTRV